MNATALSKVIPAAIESGLTVCIDAADAAKLAGKVKADTWSAFASRFGAVHRIGGGGRLVYLASSDKHFPPSLQ